MILVTAMYLQRIPGLLISLEDVCVVAIMQMVVASYQALHWNTQVLFLLHGGVIPPAKISKQNFDSSVMMLVTAMYLKTKPGLLISRESACVVAMQKM